MWELKPVHVPSVFPSNHLYSQSTGNTGSARAQAGLNEKQEEKKSLYCVIMYWPERITHVCSTYHSGVEKRQTSKYYLHVIALVQ